MKAHPLAKYLPEISADELKAMADDIAEHGQREDIVTFDDEILDGRNRFAACKLAGVKPRTRKFGSEKSDGKCPVSFVMSSNIIRRHLSEDARALIAAELSAASERGRPSEKDKGAGAPITPTQSEAAEMMNVSPAAVKRASAVVKRGGADLKKAVREGKISISAAAKATKSPKKRQIKSASKPDKRESAKAKMLAAVDKLWIDNRTAWMAPPMCQPPAMIRHIQKLIEVTL